MPNGRHSLCNKSIVVYIKFQKHLVLTLYVQHVDKEIEHGNSISNTGQHAHARPTARAHVTHTSHTAPPVPCDVTTVTAP